MKKLIFLLSFQFIGFVLFGQNPKINVKKTIRSNGQVVFVTDTWPEVGKDIFGNTINLNFSKFSMPPKVERISLNEMVSINIEFSSEFLGCLWTNRSTLKIKLSNEEIIDCIQISPTDCSPRPLAGYTFCTLDELSNSNAKEIIDANIALLSKFDWVEITIKGMFEGIPMETSLTPNILLKITTPESSIKEHLKALNFS